MGQGLLRIPHRVLLMLLITPPFSNKPFLMNIILFVFSFPCAYKSSACRWCNTYCVINLGLTLYFSFVLAMYKDYSFTFSYWHHIFFPVGKDKEVGNLDVFWNILGKATGFSKSSILVQSFMFQDSF